MSLLWCFVMQVEEEGIETEKTNHLRGDKPTLLSIMMIYKKLEIIDL